MTKKTVRFYRISVTDKFDVEGDPPRDFWDLIFGEKIADRDGGPLDFTDRHGNDYEGHFLRSRGSDGDRVIYLGKSRDKVDWPDRRLAGEEAIENVASDPSIDEIYEPCRFKSVQGTPYLAVIRSSAGAYPGAVEEFLNHAYRAVRPGRLISVKPVLRHGQVERLNEALGAARVRVVFKSSALGDSMIDKAAREIQEEAGLPARAEIVFSIGNVKDPSVMERVKGMVQGVLQGNSAEKVEATLVETDPETGETTRGFVDFMSDRVAYSIEVAMGGVGGAEYARALDEAIAEFRREVRIGRFSE